MTERWIRSPRAVAIDVGEDVVLLARDGTRTLTGPSAELARAVVDLLAAPRSDAEVLAHVEALAGDADRGGVVTQLLELLRATGCIEPAPATSSAGVRRGCNVVVGITGAIAAAHAPSLVVALQRAGYTVEIAVTPSAQRMVARDALAAIAQREPHVSLWPRVAHAPLPHIALAEWAELVIVYPASATTIARLAHGDFSELVAAIALTTRAPVVLAPSMNRAMLDAPAVQRNLEHLRGDGFAIIHGVPAHEVADAPAVRAAHSAAAPAPAELVGAIDRLRAAGHLCGRERGWDATYRRALVPWASDTCDADLAAALAEHAPPPKRVLDIGCGLGQVARHAAAAGHRVVAIDTSDVALALARQHAGDIIYLRDDICASALVGPFDTFVDRATLHAIPPERAAAWAATLRRLAAPGAIAIVKCHRDAIPGTTTAYTGAALAELLGDFALVSEESAELPSPTEAAPLPARLIVLRRAKG